LYAFRWKDWADYKSTRPSQDPGFQDQLVAWGDGATKDFQLIKTYKSGEQSYARPIRKPVAGSVRIGLQGDPLTETIHYEVDETTGIITFYDAPAEGADVTAGFEFDVPVRFDTDRIQTSVASFQAGEAPSVPVVEVRV
ncbi:MAG TPA: TIGR02217 family protein, partial [Rhodobacterales bacterium]|nr:TIGR02217 family protein [Rhodobacterales bacterium]